MVIPGNLLFQLCVLDFPATLRSFVLSFLLEFLLYSFPQNSQKNSSIPLPSFFGVFFRKPLFYPPIHRSASMAFPTTPFSCTPLVDGLLLSAEGPLPLQSATFQIPFYRCRILIAPQSTNLILCQPLQRRHVVSQDRATWPNNLHER